MKIKDIGRFEEKNARVVGKLKINVFELVTNDYKKTWKLNPIRIADDTEPPGQPGDIDLLLYDNHYILIKKLHSFIGNHNSNWVCRRCFNSFTTEETLRKHNRLCGDIEECIIKFPEGQLHFNKYFHKVPLPFRIYADFECMNTPHVIAQEHNTKNIAKQIPFAVGFYIVSLPTPQGDGEVVEGLPSINEGRLKTEYKHYMGLDCIEWFVKQLCEIETKMHFYFQNMIKNPVEIKMTAEDEHNYNSSTICWLCNQVITPQKGGKVRDHCHLTGKYRGAACSSCNINVKQKQSSFIPVIFHNFSGYDCHLFFNELFKQKDRRKFDCIPKTDEEYISVNFGCLRFIDSYRFLQSKLAKLVETIPDTPLLSNHFQNVPTPDIPVKEKTCLSV